MDEPEQAPPWRAEDGDPPVAWSWPPEKSPALYVRIDGRWVPSPVIARLVYADGRVAYRVVVAPPFDGGYERTFARGEVAADQVRSLGRSRIGDGGAVPAA